MATFAGDPGGYPSRSTQQVRVLTPRFSRALRTLPPLPPHQILIQSGWARQEAALSAWQAGPQLSAQFKVQRFPAPPPNEITHLCMKREASEQKTENGGACPTLGLGDA